jgi:hypothetical protein
MKNKILLIVLILTLACQEKKESTNKQIVKDLVEENFDWLVGDWKRTNNEEGKETFESWKKESDTEYLGFGFTIQEKDTISQEKIRLVKENSKWNLHVIAPGDTAPTTFKISSFDANSFTCLNPENEFPKKISYSLEGEKLKAVISGGGMEIPFEFKRIE